VPTPTSPLNGAQISNGSQPVSLRVQNANVSTGVAPTYTFEVATDSAFANKVQVKSGVPQGTDGQTTVKLDTLSGSQQYFWHAQAAAGGTVASFSPMFNFTIGAVVSLGSPVPLSPVNGATTSDRVPLVVADVSRAGPTGVIFYRFDIADNSAFSPVIISGTVPEGAGQTVFVPPVSLPTGSVLYWRAAAMDTTNGVTGGTSPIQSLTAMNPSAAALIATQMGLTLWPAAQPPGAAGHATMGGGWEIANRVDYRGIPFLSPPLEALRIFDLLDSGMDPDSAIRWMQSNGYPTVAVYYPSVRAIGFESQYMALVNGLWALVLRVGA
jgi:hypothetical protein